MLGLSKHSLKPLRLCCLSGSSAEALAKEEARMSLFQCVRVIAHATAVESDKEARLLKFGLHKFCKENLVT